MLETIETSQTIVDLKLSEYIYKDIQLFTMIICILHIVYSAPPIASFALLISPLLLLLSPLRILGEPSKKNVHS